MRTDTPDGISLAVRLEQAMQRYHVLAHRGDLRPAQWSALRYFAHAPAERRRLTDFARARGTTKGTASATVSKLIRRGLIARTDPGQRAGLRTTAEGLRYLAQDPLDQLAALIAEIPPEERRVLGAALDRLVSNLGGRDPSDVE